MTAANQSLSSPDKSPKGTLCGSYGGQTLGYLNTMHRSMSRSMSIDSHTTNMSHKHTNANTAVNTTQVGRQPRDPPLALPSRVRVLTNRRTEFNAKFQIRKAMPHYSKSNLDADQQTNRCGLVTEGNCREKKTSRGDSIDVTAASPFVEGDQEVCEGVTGVPLPPDITDDIIPQPVVLSSLQQRIERLLVQRSRSIRTRGLGLVPLPVLESRGSTMGPRSSVVLDRESESADVRAQVPGFRYPPLREHQQGRIQLQSQSTVSLDSRPKPMRVSLSHPRLCIPIPIPANVKSQESSSMPVMSSYMLPGTSLIRLQHSGQDSIRLNEALF